MKFRSYATLVAAIVVAAVLAFVLPGQQGGMAAMTAVMFTVMTAFSAFANWPPGARFIAQNPRWMVGLGIGLLGVAILIFTWSFIVAMRPGGAGDVYITASVVVSLTGFLLISSPRITRQSQDARALREMRNKQGRAADGAYDGVREGGAALTEFLGDAPIFLRLAWPWLLLSSGPLLLVAVLSTWGQMSVGVFYGAFGIGFVGLVVGLPTICVAWHRWTLGQGAPRAVIALPDRAAFSYGWRLWIFVGIANRAAAWASDPAGRWAKAMHLPQSAIIEAFVDVGSFTLICALFGMKAIRLPAVALGEKRLSLPVAVIAAGNMRLALPVGLLVAFAPFSLLRFGCETVLIGEQQSVGVLSAAMGAQFAVQIVLFAGGATFLSRAYSEMKARLEPDLQ